MPADGGRAPGEKKGGSAVSDESEIRDVVATFERALNSGDSNLAASCYTEDGMFMPSMAPTVSGAGIAPFYAEVFSHVQLSLRFRVIEVATTSSQSAYVITESTGTERDLTSGETTADANREVFLMARADDSWRIERLIFNKAPAAEA
jgi:uncharacterized protein (TIGR02246 family)